MNARNQTLFRDHSFPKTIINKFVAQQLNIDETAVVDTLYAALPTDKQTEANKALLTKAAGFTVNASGAFIVFVNTNEGLQLVVAHSQRRKNVVSHNGTCETDECLADAALREALEELGNPMPGSILFSLLNNPNNIRSLDFRNKIGSTAAEIANRIVDKKANPMVLYVNMSAVCVNDQPVNFNTLQAEINALNVKLRQSQLYYWPAVELAWGNKEKGIPQADFNKTEVKTKACEIINTFKTNCQASMSTRIVSTLERNYSADNEGKSLREALLAIIDVSENDALLLLPKHDLLPMLKADDTKRKERFFTPAFENIDGHIGTESAEIFLSGLERLASPVRNMTLGFTAENKTTTAAELAAQHRM